MTPRYLDTSLSPEERAKDLMNDMSTQEKMAQLGCIFPFMSNFDDEEAISAQTPLGIGQVSTLQMREFHTTEDCCAWQRKLQTIIMANSPHHIPAAFHMEGLCGPFVQNGTSFPSGVGRGSGWDPELEEKIGETISRQEAAVGISQMLAPVLDISRDHRMGRTGEAYGEDPALVSAMGAAFTRGVQKNTVAGRNMEGVAKHFLSFHNGTGGIHGAHSNVGDRELREVFGRPFQAAFNAGLKGVMPCYCIIDGEPASVSRRLLTGLLRDEMGFTGVAVSDYGGIANSHNYQGMDDAMADTAYRAMKAGMDVELPSVTGYNEELAARFDSGELDMQVLDTATLRVLTAKFRMGIFEHPFALEGGELKEVFFDENDKELSLQSARESLVLLKNDGALPIGNSIRKIAIIGPHAAFANKMFGGYTHLSMAESTFSVASSIAGVEGGFDEEKMAAALEQMPPEAREYAQQYMEMMKRVEFVPGTQVQSDETEVIQAVFRRQQPNCPSLVEKLREKLPGAEIIYAYGYGVFGADQSRFAEALKAVQAADVVLLTLGGRHGTCSLATTGEGVDAANINLPECQDEFLKAAAKYGKPMVGLHFDGRPISSDIADRNLNAILECWNPAEMGAEAIVSALLGEFSPSGKLPLTVARNAGQLPVHYNHPGNSAWHQSASIGFQDYVDLPHTPRYCFGHGLTYTAFEYRDLHIEKAEVPAGDSLRISFNVENTGNREATEIVQLYLRDPHASMARPVKELAGFGRIDLKPGEKKQVEFHLSTTQLAFLDEDMRWKVEHGEIEVQAGASSEDIRLTGSFHITGDRWIDGKARACFALASCR